VAFFGNAKAQIRMTQRTLAICVRRIHNEFNVSEELAGLMAAKGTTAGEDFHDGMKNVLGKLNIPVHKLVEL
jgi:hypothetical protein